MTKKILFLVPYPLHEAPSQRFRFEQYFGILRREGYTFTVQSFLNSSEWKLFFKRGNVLTKSVALLKGIGKRIIALFMSPMYDFVFIHREAAPFGPPFFEWALARVFRRRIIYDFDDAIWLTDRKNESGFFSLLKYRTKVSVTCTLAHKVSCGNEYLCEFAAVYNKNVVYNPTTIDTDGFHNPALYKERYETTANRVRIGWTGTHSTLKYLHDIEDVLEKLLREYHYVEFIIVADRVPNLRAGLTFKFISWRKEREIEDLLQFDIGVMPLPNDEWAKGKCGFKALQYMALALPAVASPVGVNKTIISNGVNGYLCDSLQDWEEALRRLIENKGLRRQLGAEGRKSILADYSVASNTPNFLSLFE